ncbi:MAG: DUF2520 domain-containing protein [Flavobacteriaceae bacterium]|nr:MAG: DUF2520 domain-containing protein [Flavobacteriaceae bacterium]
MQTVVVLGAGNVASHIIKALIQNTFQVKQIYNRTLQRAELLSKEFNIPFTDKISEIQKADLYIIATSDDSIKEISFHIPYPEAMVVHTSGSMSIEEIKPGLRRGVIYPLQTLTAGRNLEYEDIPIFIEAENSQDLESLRKFAEKISLNVQDLDSKARLKLHMSAVWVNNFTNHIYQIASDFCAENGVSFDVLKPLILETAHKIEYLTPLQAQTGPAKRRNQDTINKHLELITDKELKEIYATFSHLIQKKHAQL